MMGTTDEKDLYLSSFERLEKSRFGGEASWLRDIRNEALSRFAESGFPTTRLEEWKYTSLAPLQRIPFELADGHGGEVATPQLVEDLLGECGGTRLVFVDGRYSMELSSLDGLPRGAGMGSLAAALDARGATLEPFLAQYARYQHHALVALNTAFMRDGAWVHLPRGTVLEEPIHLLFLSTVGGHPTVSHPRNLIVAEESCQATIIESYFGLETGIYFTNAVTEIVVGENAAIDHYKLQRESDQAFHIATLQAHQERNSAFSNYSISLGGALVRNDVNVTLAAEGAECVLNGLFMVEREQHVDNHTSIDHVKPHGSSRELYKGILGGKSTGVFDGKIVVRPDAQKTDAKQTNKNLLLSEDALINTKPQLEIFANDVKCSHGSTIGQLDDDAVFYLRSRGLDPVAARSLLTYAFANDIVSQIKVKSIRLEIDHLLPSWLMKSESGKGVR